MKKYIATILLIVICYTGFGQWPITQNLGSGNTLVQVPANGGLRANLINRSYADTTSANLGYSDSYPGSLIFTTDIQAMWLRNAAADGWIQIMPSGGTGGQRPWLISGNSGLFTSPVDPQYVGTLTNQPFGVLSNGVARLTWNTSGAFGIGSGLSYGNSGEVLTSAGSGAPPTWAAASGGSIPISSLTAAAANNTIDNLAYTQTWQWNSLIDGFGLNLLSSSADGTGAGQSVLRVRNSGANTNNGVTSAAATILNNKTGTTSTNIGLDVTASGGTNNYAIIVPVSGGSVGIGNSAPSSLLSLGTAGSQLGTLSMAGNTSGTITIQPQAAAGTYNFNLPTTAGTSGYLLTSAGGGGSPMTWTAPASLGITLQDVFDSEVGGSVLTKEDTINIASTNDNIILGSALGSTIAVDFEDIGTWGVLFKKKDSVNYRFAIQGDGHMEWLDDSGTEYGGLKPETNGRLILFGSALTNNTHFHIASRGDSAILSLGLQDTVVKAQMYYDNTNSKFGIITGGNMYVHGLTNVSTQDRLIGQTAADDNLGYITVGSGLSLAAGVLTATGSGVTTMAAIGASPNANGATISGSTLNLEPADASFGGVVTTGAQTFAGVKTLTSPIFITPALGTPASGTVTNLTGTASININGTVGATTPTTATFTTPTANTSIELSHATANTLTASGGQLSIEGVAIPTISSTNTITNKRWTARVGSTTSSATPTINTDNTDIYKLTAQTADITSFTTNLSGTPVDGDILEIQITGTAARAITWGASFVSSTVTLPATTVTTATLTVILQYFTTSSYGNNKWVCVNSF